jgi:1-aminocyclopropane-1-carboxylate deaminase
MSSEIPLLLPSPLQEIQDNRLNRKGIRLFLKRDDLINSDISGNKWRKLKYTIAAAKAGGHTTLLTFGGAYSNHIRAVAAAGHYFGFETIGVIRGEEHLPLNPSLTYAVSRGMRLTYMDRDTYRHKHEAAVIHELRRQFDDFYLIPEGGSNALALRGTQEIPAEITEPFDIICCAVGTGGTLAGIAAGLDTAQQAIGFTVLKGGQFLTHDVNRLQQQAFGTSSHNWRVETAFHFGGYAKKTPELEGFIADFEKRHSLRLDWVYVAKMLYGLFTKIDRGDFKAGTKIIAVITGTPYV